jgi:hypothetical protein
MDGSTSKACFGKRLADDRDVIVRALESPDGGIVSPVADQQRNALLIWSNAASWQ